MEQQHVTVIQNELHEWCNLPNSKILRVVQTTVILESIWVHLEIQFQSRSMSNPPLSDIEFNKMTCSTTELTKVMRHLVVKTEQFSYLCKTRLFWIIGKLFNNKQSGRKLQNFLFQNQWRTSQPAEYDFSCNSKCKENICATNKFIAQISATNCDKIETPSRDEMDVPEITLVLINCYE